MLKCSQGRFLFLLHKHSCLKRLLSAWYLSEPSSNALFTLRPRTVGAGAAGVVLACGGAGWGPWLGALAGGPGWGPWMGMSGVSACHVRATTVQLSSARPPTQRRPNNCYFIYLSKQKLPAPCVLVCVHGKTQQSVCGLGDFCFSSE